MDEHVVFQFEDENQHHYLSIYSLYEFQFRRSHVLPIYIEEDEGRFVYGNCCRGLYFFFNNLDDFVVCNLTNLESKPLTLVNLVEPPPNLAIFHACGIGQDPDSGLFKVVFAYDQHFSIEDKDDDFDLYLGVETRALFYCVDTDSFKRIECPINFMANTDTAYVGHERHWTAAMMDISEESQFPPPFVQSHVVSFNFRTEEFTYFSLPPYLNKDYKFNIVEFGAKLGAVGYCGSGQYDVWVHQEQWTRLHCLHFGPQVERVLMIKDEKLVFLEVPCEDDDRRSDVHVYDIVTDRLIGIFDIRGSRGNLDVFSYVLNRCRLLDGEPLISSYAEVKGKVKGKGEVKGRGEELNEMEAKKKNKKKKKKKNT